MFDRLGVLYCTQTDASTKRRIARIALDICIAIAAFVDISNTLYVYIGIHCTRYNNITLAPNR